MPIFEFDSKRLRPEEASSPALEEVTLDAAQRRLVQDLGDLVGPALGIDSIPCRGLWLQAVRQWQQSHALPASQISAFSPPERLRAAFEIKDHFVELASSLLVDATQKAAVQSTVDAAYAMYVSKYNRRR